MRSILFALAIAVAGTSFGQTIPNTTKPLESLGYDFFSFSDDEITPSDSMQFGYDSEEREILRVHYKWDSESEAWQMYERTEMSYNDEDDVTWQQKERWDDDSAGWMNYEQTNYSYDGSGNQTLRVIENWDGDMDQWVNSTKLERDYDNQNRQIFQLFQWWQNDAWVNWSRSTTTWSDIADPLDLIMPRYTELSSETWDGGGWEDSYLEENVFNDNGDLIFQEIQRWGEFPSHERSMWNYDENRLPIYRLTEDFINNNWQNLIQLFVSYRSVDVYDWDTVEIQAWDLPGAGGWYNLERQLFDQIGEQFESIVQYGINFTEWINSWRTLFWTMEDGRVSRLLREVWVENSESWRNLGRTDTEFDEDGDPLRQKLDDWDNDHNVWDRFSDTRYYYFKTSGRHHPISFRPLQAYPNPSNGLVTVSIPDHLIGQPVEVLVGDAVGGDIQRNFDLSASNPKLRLHGLAPGMYTIRLVSGKEQYIARVMVQ